MSDTCTCWFPVSLAAGRDCTKVVSLSTVKRWPLLAQAGRGHPPALNPFTLQALVELLSDGLDIRFEHRVTSIEYGSGGVQVTCTNGATFDCDAVIVTVSAGILQVGMHAAQQGVSWVEGWQGLPVA